MEKDLKIYDEYGNELSFEEVNLEKGYLLETERIKSNAKPIDNESKFAWAEEDFESVYIYYMYVLDHAYYERKIDEYKGLLTSTDYIILKVMEGAATFADYPDILTQRQEWRDKISECEIYIKMLDEDANK